VKLRYGVTKADKTTLSVDKETHSKVKKYARKYDISITEATSLLISYTLIEGKDPGEILRKGPSMRHSVKFESLSPENSESPSRDPNSIDAP
jgi:hypothetical protein